MLERLGTAQVRLFIFDRRLDFAWLTYGQGLVLAWLTHGQAKDRALQSEKRGTEYANTKQITPNKEITDARLAR